MERLFIFIRDYGIELDSNKWTGIEPYLCVCCIYDACCVSWGARFLSWRPQSWFPSLAVSEGSSPVVLPLTAQRSPFHISATLHEQTEERTLLRSCFLRSLVHFLPGAFSLATLTTIWEDSIAPHQGHTGDIYDPSGLRNIEKTMPFYFTVLFFNARAFNSELFVSE